MSNRPSPAQPQSDRRRPIVVYGLAAILLVVILAIAFVSRSDPSTPEELERESARTVERSPSDEPASPPPTSFEAAVEPIPEPILRQILDDYMVPGRMVFFQIHMTDTGTITLEQAKGAIGRAKPSPVRNAPGWIRVDGFDATNHLTFSHTVEDPTRRFLEHPTSSDDGSMTRTIIENESGSLFVRIPGESLATRLVLSRWSPTTSDSSTPWQPFTTIEFPK